MTPERRAEGLAAAARVRRGELLAAAERVAAVGGVTVVERPAPGTVMLELATAVGETCLSEVVVTTAAVTVADRPGWGCVLGWDDEGALAAALCDSGDPEAAAALAELALADEATARAATSAAVAATRVAFG
jgi:alpha-D-ribose 1-methylphosphonate 5-triphosphate synthase subunit PhnG